MKLWVGVWVIQGVAMLVDELVFHRRRGLGRWERLGHPLDTVSAIAPLTIAAFLPYGEPARMLFAALASVSCLLVTKDEWIHQKECGPGEHWLHSLLFLTHGLGFVAAWELWKSSSSWELQAIRSLLALMTAFLAYQTLYWNLLSHEPSRR